MELPALKGEIQSDGARAQSENRVRVAFRIMGADLDPAVVTKILGIDASHGHLCGPGQGKFARTRWHEGLWSLKCPLDPQLPLEAHFSWLLEKLEPVKDRLPAVLQGNVRADFYVSFHLVTQHTGPGLMPGLLCRLGDFGVPVGLSIWAY